MELVSILLFLLETLTIENGREEDSISADLGKINEHSIE